MPAAKITLHKRGKKLIHEIAIRVTEDRIPKYISLNASVHVNEWNDEISRVIIPKGSKNDKAKDINLMLNSKENKIDDFFRELKRSGNEFNFEEFKEYMTGKASKVYLFDYFDHVIKSMEASKNFGNASIYKSTKNSLLRFRGLTHEQVKELYKKEGEIKYPKNIKISQINLAFVKQYAEWLLGSDMTGNGPYVYMRTFRGLIKKALADKIIKLEKYPFTGFTVDSLKRVTRKRSLKESHLEAIKEYSPPPGLFKYEARLIFLWMYYCRGMNIFDVAHLKKSQIYGGRIYYVRNKLKRRTDNEINIKIRPEMQEIMDYFNDENSDYVFPIIIDDNKHITEQQKRTRVKTFTKKLNKAFENICKDLNFENINLTTYVARHTYATTLNRKGVDMANIAKGLAHGDTKTTQIYVASIEDNSLDDIELNAL